MANTLLTSSIVARAALATLYKNTVMLPLVHRDYENEFVPGVGQTVSIRKPTTFTANEYNGTTISIQNATETNVDVTLNHHRDVSFRVTSRDRALNIVDFTQQFLMPAMEAINQVVDTDILSLRSDIVQSVGDGVTSELWSDPKVLVDARKVLSDRAVPLIGRNAVADTKIAAAWLKDSLFAQANTSGSTDVITEAQIGPRKFGFTPYESENIADEKGVAFHPTAFAFVTRPLEIPRGAADASIVTYKGMGLRVVFDYDMNLKADVCSIDLLYGVKTLDANRACLIDASGS